MAARKSTRKTHSSTKSSASARSSMIHTGLSDKQMSSLRAAKQSAARRLLPHVQTLPGSAFAESTSPEPSVNLVGVGIGEQISGEKHTGIMAVKFLVRIKYPDNQIPEADRLPHEVDGHPVDVEEVGTFRRFTPQPAARQMPDPRKKIRPAGPAARLASRTRITNS